MDNKRTMKYIRKDYWSRPVYRCIETKQLWKDVNLGEGIPSLHSCGDDLEGEPDMPIRSDLEIIFIDQYQENPFRHEYMMLSRLQQDCEYYLNYGNRTKKHLYYLDEKKHIEEIKKLYNLLPEKPDWLSFEKILEYERDMVNI